MPKFFSSIFFKLMATILIAGLGINIAIIIFFGAFRHHIASNYHPHLNRYIDYLLKDIGDPPDPARARQIASETNMVISFDGKDRQWSTSDSPIEFPVDRIRIWHEDERMQAGGFRGMYRVSVRQGDGRLTFLLSRQPFAEKKIRFLGMCLFFFVTVLMICAYLTIRWVLKPLRWLKKGVDQVARGELAYRVPVKRADELRDLSVSFNAMAERLGHLIKSKEQLLLDVSHELRTPITRMKVALAMMPETRDRSSVEEDLKEMERKITILLETARSLNIKASLKFTEVDVVALIHETTRPFMAEKPTIVFEAMPDAAVLEIDAELMGQALKNIVDNSQKYSRENSNPIRISIAREGRQWVISIQDDGIGIAEEDLDFIFEPFYRADKARTPQRDGYGLGLSLAKNIIEAHGGDITVKSEIGQGTLVRIYLSHHTGRDKKL